MSASQLEPGRDTYHASRDEEINRCPSAIRSRLTLTNDAALSRMIRVTVTRNAAPPSRVSCPRNTLTHQHARPSRSLKDIINAFDLQRGALLVSSCTDSLRDSLRLRPRDVSVNIRIITRWTQVCLAAHKDYRDDRTTYGPHFFNPLVSPCDNVSLVYVALYLEDRIP
jgi:hypothetical protein